MRKRTNNINQKSLTKSNTSRPSKKSQSRNKQITVVQSKSKTKNSQKYNVYKKEGHVSKSKSKSKSREYSCILKGNKNKIQITSSLLIKKDSLQINDQRKDLKIEFQKAVTKVFHVLDIFSRGSISEANINRWVPEAALYFLGSVFQKIRVFRIVMNEPQFKQQCYKIFVKSSDEDIVQFIQNIKKHDNFNEQKISFEGDQKQTIQSQVEDRFCFQLQSGQTSFRKINIGQKTMPLQTIKSNQIYFDDDEENRQENKQEFRNKVKQNIQKSKQNKQKGDKNKISPLSHFNSFQNVAVKNKDKKVIDVENMPLKVTQKQNSSKMKNNLNNVASGSQSPFFKGSVTSVLTKLGPQKKDSVDRIDKLSLRLQDYIKQNAARLQRSKNCRIQL